MHIWIIDAVIIIFLTVAFTTKLRLALVEEKERRLEEKEKLDKEILELKEELVEKEMELYYIRNGEYL